MKGSSDIFVKTDTLPLQLTVDSPLLFNVKKFMLKNSFLFSHHTFHVLQEMVGVVGQQSQQTIRGELVK